MEGAVVHLEPGLLIRARPERSRLDGGVLFRRERSAHLVKSTARREPDGRRHPLVVGRRLAHPQVQVPAAFLADQLDSALHEVDGHRVAGRPVVGVDDDLEAPAGAVAAPVVRAQAELGVADRVGVAWLPGHEPGEAFSSPLDQVEPGVLAEGRVGICLARRRQQLGDCGQVVLVEVALDLDVGHSSRS